MIATLKETLAAAKKGKYAVGLFNTINTDMLDAAIDAAEAERSPIIIGTAEVLLPYGGLELIAPSIVHKAKTASVPVVVHFDHGLTFGEVMHAAKLGFSSVMYDCSSLNESDNITATRQMTEIAHALGMSIEGEIGHIGGSEGGYGADSSDIYTTVAEAKRFAEGTGVDALAVAIGTVHGHYRTAPKLSFERLRQISQAVDTPLVLHGGSGLSEQDFKMCIAEGVAKVNIFTDLTVAAERAMRDGLKDGKGYLDVRNMQKEYIKQEIIKKIRIFGSNNKA